MHAYMHLYTYLCAMQINTHTKGWWQSQYLHGYLLVRGHPGCKYSMFL